MEEKKKSGIAGLIKKHVAKLGIKPLRAIPYKRDVHEMMAAIFNGGAKEALLIIGFAQIAYITLFDEPETYDGIVDGGLPEGVIRASGSNYYVRSFPDGTGIEILLLDQETQVVFSMHDAGIWKGFVNYGGLLIKSEMEGTPMVFVKMISTNMKMYKIITAIGE